MAEAHLQKEKTSQSIQEADGGWCIRQHLLGCSLLAQVQCGFHGTLKEKKIYDAVRCFFRYLTEVYLSSFYSTGELHF